MGNLSEKEVEIMSNKPKCAITVDVEALTRRARDRHIDTLIYGKQANGEKWGIGRMMDIADKHQVRLTFFLDFAETELYGNAIIQVGKYILSRGHDLQIHCHYNYLSEKVLKLFPDVTTNYCTWCEKDEEISEYMLNHCLEQYYKCTAKPPVAFRGGGYRVGTAFLKSLKDKGIAADCSYNLARPIRLPVNRNFVFENNLIEIPIGIIPGELSMDYREFNFNSDRFYPKTPDDFDKNLKEYEKMFRDFYWYYGEHEIAAMIMHSWSFCKEKNRFKETGYIDRPNAYAAELFDQFLGKFSETIDFVTITDAVNILHKRTLKSVDFDAVFSLYGKFSLGYLRQVETFIREMAGDRDVVIWGKGWMENIINQSLNVCKQLNVKCFISQDAPEKREWRGKPVKTFEEIRLTPKRYYVFIIAQAAFTEIREQLCEIGFVENIDFYDIEGTKNFTNSNLLETGRTLEKLFLENLYYLQWDKMEVLHVSPSMSERKVLQTYVRNITTLGVYPELKTDIVADLCNMPHVRSDTYNMVLVGGVLDYVYNDELALSEIHRVLRTSGLFITYVAGNKSMKTTVVENIVGQNEKDKVMPCQGRILRHYGENDFTAQLQRHFSTVRCYEKYDEPTETSVSWYVCKK